MDSILHPDIANIDTKTATPEQLEKLMSDPLMRSLQYQIQHGVRDIKLETNKGEFKINNMRIPEGADRDAHIQKMMAEENKNKVRAPRRRLPHSRAFLAARTGVCARYLPHSFCGARCARVCARA